VFTARYVLSPYIKQICFFFKGLNKGEDVPCVYALIYESTGGSEENILHIAGIGMNWMWAFRFI
jgi:hypothetical protein